MDNPTWQELKTSSWRAKSASPKCWSTTPRTTLGQGHPEEIATLEAQLKDTPERVPGTTHETINPVYQQLVQARMPRNRKSRPKRPRFARPRRRSCEWGIRPESGGPGEAVRRHSAEHDEAKDSTSSITRVARPPEPQPGAERAERHAGGDHPTCARAGGPYRGDRLPLAIACVGAGVAAGFVLTFLLQFVDHSLSGAGRRRRVAGRARARDPDGNPGARVARSREEAKATDPLHRLRGADAGVVSCNAGRGICAGQPGRVRRLA